MARTIVIKVRILISSGRRGGCCRSSLWLSRCRALASGRRGLCAARSISCQGSLGSLLAGQVLLRSSCGRCAAHGPVDFSSEHFQALPGVFIRVYLHTQWPVRIRDEVVAIGLLL